MSNKKGISRRRLLQTVVVAPVVMTGCATTVTEEATVTEEEVPLLRATDPVARSLAYFPNTRDVPADNPLAATHDVNQKCANCVHGRGSAGPGRIQCPTFPGRTVNADGWCSLWAQG